MQDILNKLQSISTIDYYVVVETSFGDQVESQTNVSEKWRECTVCKLRLQQHETICTYKRQWANNENSCGREVGYHF